MSLLVSRNREFGTISRNRSGWCGSPGHRLNRIHRQINDLPAAITRGRLSRGQTFGQFGSEDHTFALYGALQHGSRFGDELVQIHDHAVGGNKGFLTDPVATSAAAVYSTANP